VSTATTFSAHAFSSAAEAGAAAGHARAVFAAEGIRCASCSRSIERAVGAMPGVARVNVNVATSRVCVEWDAAKSSLDAILRAVADAGFKPLPLAGEAAESAFARERRTALKRIGLAGLGMMQVMMYVFGVYVARPEAIDPAIASYLKYVGMAITTPVLLYSGVPFFVGAWNDLRRRALGMDVPVALALCLAYAASVFNTVRGEGQTYFDSVTMFIFFLSAGRYVEMVVRQRSLSISDAVGRSLPAQVSRVRADGSTERVAVRAIVAGDTLQIPKGGVIPVDSTLAAGIALVDESLVTGESRAEKRAVGEALLGGSLSVGGAIRVIARRDMADSTLASVVALLERAQGSRPQIARAADRVANWFVAATLLLAFGVVAAWMAYDPTRAFPAALAVLVVTCPCALSLATPVAVAAASTRLARRGLLVTRADALERLAGIDTVVFDKTGTLTSAGRLSITGMTMLGSLDKQAALAIAAALERGSSHPIAMLFARYDPPKIAVTDVQEVEGSGVEARIEGIGLRGIEGRDDARLGDTRWRIGRHDFVAELAADTAAPPGDLGVYLGNEQGLVALFELGEVMRPEAVAAIGQLRVLGVEPIIASGDRGEAVDAVRTALQVDRASARLAPAGKMQLVRELQAGGRRVLAIGDGVNDGPALAIADVSCAMGEGSAIAQAASDLLLLNDGLSVVGEAIETSRRMMQVIRQNLRWSLVYNLAAVPLAAFDLVPPWLAAIGMSASSLVVVLNARRLAAGKADR
jgi:P-type Cu2+ transporter